MYHGWTLLVQTAPGQSQPHRSSWNFHVWLWCNCPWHVWNVVHCSKTLWQLLHFVPFLTLVSCTCSYYYNSFPHHTHVLCAIFFHFLNDEMNWVGSVRNSYVISNFRIMFGNILISLETWQLCTDIWHVHTFTTEFSVFSLYFTRWRF